MRLETKLSLDPGNPGQVLACLGLWEVVTACEGPSPAYFENRAFHIQVGEQVIETAFQAFLKAEAQGEGDKAISIGSPFNWVLDWWRGDERVPKTWAGGQNAWVLFITFLDYLRKKKIPYDQWLDWQADTAKAFESSFCFDAREFNHALDTGFSLYDTKVQSLPFPYVNVLAFIGLQAYRLRPLPDGAFAYRIWTKPLWPTLASLVFSSCMTLDFTRPYRFRLQGREEGNRYKAMTFAILGR